MKILLLIMCLFVFMVKNVEIKEYFDISVEVI